MTLHGIDVGGVVVIDRIDDGDWLDYMLVASAEQRVFMYFVLWDPSETPSIGDWREITREIDENPWCATIQAVLTSLA